MHQVADDLSSVESHSDVTSDDDLSSEDGDEFVEEMHHAKAAAPGHHHHPTSEAKSHLDRMAGLLAGDPKRRRASIAVWTDQKLSDMSKSKTAPTAIT